MYIIYIYNTYYTNVQQPLCRHLALLGRLSSLPKGLPDSHGDHGAVIVAE